MKTEQGGRRGNRTCGSRPVGSPVKCSGSSTGGRHGSIPATTTATDRYRRWSEADDRRLRRIWGEGTIEATARAIGRSPIATYWRGRKLGLPCGAPQGYAIVGAR